MAEHPTAFYDCFDFWGPRRGLVMGDASTAACRYCAPGAEASTVGSRASGLPRRRERLRSRIRHGWLVGTEGRILRISC